MRNVIILLVFSSALGACAIDPLQVSPSTSSTSAGCTGSHMLLAMDNDAKVQDSIAALPTKRLAVINNLPNNLRQDKVVNSVIDLMIRRSLESSYSMRTKDLSDKSKTLIETTISNTTPATLYASNFESLFKALISPKGAGHRVIEYEAAYVEGSFVDRLGAKLPKPTLAMTVTDQEIAAVLTAFLEAVADDLFSTTPVWTSTDGKTFYPGGFTMQPTFVTYGLAQHPPLTGLTAPLADAGCGMTKLKADALAYLSGKAATWAAGETGFVLGAFGGVNGGPVFVLGKFSIGDNKTLQTVAQTILASAAKRATFEGARQVLESINQPANWTLGDLIDNLVFAGGSS